MNGPAFGLHLLTAGHCRHRDVWKLWAPPKIGA
jgi:hypothetical protein